MTDQVSGTQLARFLCSRLCHDLVSPAGAVNAGMELYEEDPAHGAEALSLVRRSALQMTRRLSFYRMAFGMGGGSDGRISVEALRLISEDLLREGNIRLDWSLTEDTPGEIALLAGKLVLNVVFSGIDCLPRGGNLLVRLARLEENLGLAVQGNGVGARPSDELVSALAGKISIENLTARNVQGVLVKTLADEIGAELELDSEIPGEVRIAAMIPAV